MAELLEQLLIHRRDDGLSSGTLGRDNHLTDWPEREPSKLQMRPGKGDADNGYGEQDRSDYVREREPPAGED
jgi:hypothetical protein